MKNKLLISLLLLSVANIAHADSCATGLMPLFTAPQAKKLCSYFSAGTIGVLANNTYLIARNAANSANINVLKVDATDDTVLNADTGDVIKLAVAGTTEIQIDNDSLTFTGAAAKIIPGATSLTFRNTTDAADTLSITNAGNVTIAGNLLMSTTQSKFIPGATLITFRNNADNADNLIITDAGLVKVMRASDLIFNVGAATIALQEAVAGTACMGTLTANGATPVVTSTTCATTGSRVFLTRTSAETGTVSAWRSALSNGVSFSITSEAADTGSYDWLIVHESP